MKIYGNVLFLSYHLPMSDQPGPARPFVEANLLKKIGFRVHVVMSGIHHIQDIDIRKNKGPCSIENHDDLILYKLWGITKHRSSIFRRILHYMVYAILAFGISLKIKKIDYIFCGSHPLTIPPIALLLSKIKRAKLIVDERDLYPETAIAMGVIKKGVLARILYGLRKLIWRHSASILTVSPGIKTTIVSQGVPEDKVRVLYNIDFFYKKDSLNGKSKNVLVEIERRSFWVAYCGTLGAVSDLPTLFDVASRLKDTPEIGFLIIGGGEMAEAYKNYCRENNIKNVVFVGALPRDDARSLLSRTDACIHLYPDNENFENAIASKIFDYLCAGKPIIFCGKGDTAALLREAKAGIIVNPQEPIELEQAVRLIASDKILRENLSMGAEKWLENNISINNAVHLFENIFVKH